MVAVNVSQLLLLGPGTVRSFDFDEPFPDPANELRLHGPIRGRSRLTRTTEGILVHADYHARVAMECARCLEQCEGTVTGSLDEEFFPSTDIRTGSPIDVPAAPTEDVLLINEHHEIDLDEVLRQNVLTNLPLRPLCTPDCPGLCATCGERLDAAHQPHPESEVPADAQAATSPFAQLAVLLKDDSER